jgi:hypothetical protein
MSLRVSVSILVASYALGAALACYDPKDPHLPPVEPDYPRASEIDAGEVCAHLRALGCPEGSPTPGGRPCEAALTSARRLLPYPEGCWLDAGTVDAAVACGGLRCVP